MKTQTNRTVYLTSGTHQNFSPLPFSDLAQAFERAIEWSRNGNVAVLTSVNDMDSNDQIEIARITPQSARFSQTFAL